MKAQSSNQWTTKESLDIFSSRTFSVYNSYLPFRELLEHLEHCSVPLCIDNKNAIVNVCGIRLNFTKALFFVDQKRLRISSFIGFNLIFDQMIDHDILIVF